MHNCEFCHEDVDTCIHRSGLMAQLYLDLSVLQCLHAAQPSIDWLSLMWQAKSGNLEQ